MFTVVAICISTWTAESGQVHNQLIAVVCATNVEVVDPQLWPVLFRPNIHSEILICGTQPCARHFNRHFVSMESDLHTVPFAIFNFNFVFPVIWVIVLHECDQCELAESLVLASCRTSRNQPHKIAAICPEEQLHICPPTFQACCSERESKSEIIVGCAI